MTALVNTPIPAWANETSTSRFGRGSQPETFTQYERAVTIPACPHAQQYNGVWIYKVSDGKPESDQPLMVFEPSIINLCACQVPALIRALIVPMPSVDSEGYTDREYDSDEPDRNELTKGTQIKACPQCDTQSEGIYQPDCIDVEATSQWGKEFGQIQFHSYCNELCTHQVAPLIGALTRVWEHLSEGVAK